MLKLSPMKAIGDKKEDEEAEIVANKCYRPEKNQIEAGESIVSNTKTLQTKYF